jgi:AbrB family looped-hinge helix DNA binding protein
MQTAELSVGKQGRIVIPARLRHQLALEPGVQLLAWVEDGWLILESKQQLWQSVHQACSKIPEQLTLRNSSSTNVGNQQKRKADE